MCVPALGRELHSIRYWSSKAPAKGALGEVEGLGGTAGASFRHCVIESIGRPVGSASMLRFEVCFIGAVVLFTAICLVTDVKSRRIPNWLTVPAFVLGLVTHTVAKGLPGLQFSLAGFGTGFGVLFVLWRFGGGGGGDVKMMGALGAWLGAWLTVQVFVASAVATMFLAGGVLLFRAITRKSRRDRSGVADRPARKSKAESGRRKPADGFGRIMPYAVPLAVGTWAGLFHGGRVGGFP